MKTELITQYRKADNDVDTRRKTFTIKCMAKNDYREGERRKRIFQQQNREAKIGYNHTGIVIGSKR